MSRLSKFILGVAVAFGLLAANASAQTSSTRATLEAQNNAVIAPNGVGSITGAKLNGMLGNMIASTFTLLDPIPKGLWGCATAPSCVPSSLTTLPSGLTIPTATLTGLTTVGNIFSNASAAISQPFSGATVNAGIVYDLTAVSANSPEVTAVFRMTSGIGGSSVAHFKQALGAELFENNGSAPAWVFTGAKTTGAGYPILTQTSVGWELDDQNNSLTNAILEDPGATGHYASAFVITGAGSNQLTSAITIAGLNKFLVGTLYSSQGPALADVASYSPAQTSWLDNGSHINGFNFGGATISANFLVGPGADFFVTGTGALTALSGTITSFSTAGAVCNSVSGVLSTTTGKCAGSDPSDVTSVSNSDGTLTISPTTGAVVASIALGHANMWAGQQTFVAPILGTPASGTLTNATGYPTSSLVGTVSPTHGGTGVTDALPIITISVGSTLNFNSVADTSFSVVLPTGANGYLINGLRVYNCTAAITSASFGVFTAATGGGFPAVPAVSGTNTAQGPNTVLSTQSGAAASSWFNATTLFFRVTVAQGSAVTCAVDLTYIPLQ